MSDPCTFVPGCTETPEWRVDAYRRTRDPATDDQMVTEDRFLLCLTHLHEWVHAVSLCTTDSAVVFAREARIPVPDCGPVPYLSVPFPAQSARPRMAVLEGGSA